jgi:ferredoxin-type protein NapH
LGENNQSGGDTLERKRRTLKALKSRRIKQYFTGTIFILLFIGGWLYPIIGFFIPICMIAGLGLATLKGRTWCDWMCPRGSFSDSYLKAISPHKAIPYFLRSFPVRIGVLSFLMLMLGYQIVRLWPDPYAIGMFFMVLLSITTSIAIILALLIHQRSWCYVCPVGSLANWVGKNREKLHMEKDACITCKFCAKICPMNLNPQELKTNNEMAFYGDCLKCGLCVQTCRKDVLNYLH